METHHDLPIATEVVVTTTATTTTTIVITVIIVVLIGREHLPRCNERTFGPALCAVPLCATLSTPAPNGAHARRGRRCPTI